MMSERLVQYEFKVIVQASSDAWPDEIQDAIKSSLEESEIWITGNRKEWLHVQSVERVRDGY